MNVSILLYVHLLLKKTSDIFYYYHSNYKDSFVMFDYLNEQTYLHVVINRHFEILSLVY